MFNNCCCVADCWIYKDDFNRADDTDLGADWTEDSGSWAINGNTLKTSSANAFCYYDATQNDPVYFANYVGAGMSVLVSVKASASGSEAGINAYQLSAAEDLIVKIVFGASASIVVMRGATVLMDCSTTAPVDTWVDLRIDYCALLGDNFISVWVDGVFVGTRYVYGSSPDILSEQVGCYVSSNTGDVFFDDFTVKENSTWGSYPVKGSCAVTAPPCYWPMVGTEAEMPATVTLEVADYDFGGGVTNGTYVLNRVGTGCSYELDVFINGSANVTNIVFRYETHFNHFEIDFTGDDFGIYWDSDLDVRRFYWDDALCGYQDLTRSAGDGLPLEPSDGTFTISY